MKIFFNKDYSKIFFFNLILILLGFLAIEIFNKILSKESIIIFNKYSIPRLKCNTKLNFDVSNIYESDEPIFSSYIRNKDCYRSFNDKSNLPKILIIGGSTTDERFISEGQTFTDLLDEKFKNKIDFVNGGVDGQSTHGHLYSLINWHKNAMSKYDLKEIIFYIGINDRSIFRDNIIYSPKYTKKRKLQDFLDNNSKIFRYAKSIYLSKNIPKNLQLSAHSKKFNFIDNGKLKSVDISIKSENYSKHFRNLILESLILFPDIKLKFIQQDIPGCKFFNKFEFINRHGEDYSDICNELSALYLTMDNVVNNLDKNLKPNVSVHKMYLHNIIKDDDVYDAVHTNSKGSRKIANYISSLYNSK